MIFVVLKILKSLTFDEFDSSAGWGDSDIPSNIQINCKTKEEKPF